MFTICELPLGHGRIGLCPLPGRWGDYPGDLARVLAWHPDLVVSLMTANEFEVSEAALLPADLAARGLAWRHLPVRDFGRPAPGVEAAWAALSGTARAILSGGGRVLVHCFGGCGRSGMVLLRLMVEAGEAPEAALARLRSVRPCAVETPGQLVWATATLATAGTEAAVATGTGPAR
jgi:protein-tyrosine phosphatase